MPSRRGNHIAVRPLHVRFWPKVDASGGIDACWPWTGARSEKRGLTRGVVRCGSELEGVKGPLRYAHVVALAFFTDGAFEKFDDETGERLQACHRCHNRLCCNGRHLYWGTRAQNDEDRYGRTTREFSVTAEDLLEALGLPFYVDLRDVVFDASLQVARVLVSGEESFL